MWRLYWPSQAPMGGSPSHCLGLFSFAKRHSKRLIRDPKAWMKGRLPSESWARSWSYRPHAVSMTKLDSTSGTGSSRSLHPSQVHLGVGHSLIPSSERRRGGEAVPLSPQHPVAKSLPVPHPVPPSLTGCCRDRATSHPRRAPVSPPPPLKPQDELLGGSGFPRGGVTPTRTPPPPLLRLEMFLHKRLSVYSHVRIGSG